MYATKAVAFFMIALNVANALRSGPVKVTEAAAPAKALAGTSSKHTLATNATTSMMTEMELGPFEDHAAACTYCYQSHTKSLVVPHCICTAYTGDDGPTMFCTGSKPGVAYSRKRDGACKCVEKDMQQMGKTTCVSWDE